MEGNKKIFSLKVQNKVIPVVYFSVKKANLIYLNVHIIMKYLQGDPSEMLFKLVKSCLIS